MSEQISEQNFRQWEVLSRKCKGTVLERVIREGCTAEVIVELKPN